MADKQSRRCISRGTEWLAQACAWYHYTGKHWVHLWVCQFPQSPGEVPHHTFNDHSLWIGSVYVVEVDFPALLATAGVIGFFLVCWLMETRALLLVFPSVQQDIPQRLQARIPLVVCTPVVDSSFDNSVALVRSCLHWCHHHWVSSCTHS